MTFHEWAVLAGLTIEQIRSYQTHMGIYDERLRPEVGRSEAAVEARVKVRMSQRGGRAWKNNKGAAYLADGTFLRYGLLNQSQRISDEIKSADLVGIDPVLITPEMIGMIFGRFWCREVKREDWEWSGDEHEMAQLRFAELVLALGGDAGFINHEDQL